MAWVFRGKKDKYFSRDNTKGMAWVFRSRKGEILK